MGQDEVAHYEPSHLDLQCLQIQLLLCLPLYGLNFGYRISTGYYFKIFR